MEKKRATAFAVIEIVAGLFLTLYGLIFFLFSLLILCLPCAADTQKQLLGLMGFVIGLASVIDGFGRLNDNKRSDVTSESPSATPSKKNMSTRNRRFLATIGIILVVFLLLIALVAVTYRGYPIAPAIATHKRADATATNWTVMAIYGAGPILKSEVYVQLKNASGVLVITFDPLSTASGTHGFDYVAATQGSIISVGDIFSLSNDYSTGTVLNILAYEMGTYCVLTV